MRTIDGKTVLLFGPEWSLFELAELFGKRGYQLKRHESGAIEIVKKVEAPKVVPIRKGVRADQPRIPFLSNIFSFDMPEHDGPGAA